MREMKDSGIEWVGKIPAEWEVEKNKRLFFEVNNKCLATDSYTLLSVSEYYGVAPRTEKIKDGDFETRAESLDGYKICQKNDIVMNIMLAWKRATARTSYDGIVSPAYCVYRGKDIETRYYHYVFRTEGCADYFKRHSTGIIDSRLRLYPESFFNLNSPVPPIIEQKQIADFLDNRCSEIDAISADIQKEIETLEQYKRSVITEAVTKGLNPDVEMKDSGIEWVGKVPASWTSSRLGYETYIRARLGWKGLKADEYVDDGYAFISAFNIQNNKLVWTPLNYITKERYDESPEIKLNIGDVIIVKDGAGIGKCARIDSLPMGETAPNSSIGVITPLAKLNYRYLAYYLQSAIFNNLILKLLNGMGVPHLTQEVMNKTTILMPPKQEQIRIAAVLDAKCNEIDSAIEAKKKQIDILDTYKKSLIYEYVTGKKEVPAQN